MQHNMLYLKQNADIPSGRVTSTARKGIKWSNFARVGDVLSLRYTEGNEEFGKAVVTGVSLMSYEEILDRADENHTGQRPLAAGKTARQVLAEELAAAYGPTADSDVYTQVSFVRINP